MNLNFKTHFPWPGADGKPEPTHFQEQVLNALHPERVAAALEEFLPEPKPVAFKVLVTGQLDPARNGVHELVRGKKLHTIRRIKNGKARFREGMTLTFSTGKLYHYKRFGEAMCTGVQLLSMRFNAGPKGDTFWLEVDIDGTACSEGMLRRLAQNDGFARTSQFTRWFLLDLLTNGPGDYHLVHWTDLRY